jgi:acetyltransferase-like isoleucine patch superfamily enzyme
MRRSVIGPVLFWAYRWSWPRFRRICGSLLLRLEGGRFYSLTLRQILRHYHGVEVGAYGYGACMEPYSWPSGVTIGRYASVARGVRVFLEDHPLERLSQHPFFHSSTFGWVPEDNIAHGRLEIGHDAWLGAGSIITSKCTRIGIGAVIGAGSIVTKDVPDFAIVAGNPARILRYRFPEEVRQQILESRWWERSIEECARSLDAMTRPIDGPSALSAAITVGPDGFRQSENATASKAIVDATGSTGK